MTSTFAVQPESSRNSPAERGLRDGKGYTSTAAATRTPTFTLSVLALTSVALVGTAWRAKRQAALSRADQQAWRSVALRLLEQQHMLQRSKDGSTAMAAPLSRSLYPHRHQQHEPWVEGRKVNTSGWREGQSPTSLERQTSSAAMDRPDEQAQLHNERDRFLHQEETRDWNSYRRNEEQPQNNLVPRRSFDQMGNLVKEILPVPKELLPQGATGIDARITSANGADGGYIHPHHDWNWTPADYPPRLPRGRPGRLSVAQVRSSSALRGEKAADSVGWTSSKADDALWIHDGSSSETQSKGLTKRKASVDKSRSSKHDDSVQGRQGDLTGDELMAYKIFEPSETTADIVGEQGVDLEVLACVPQADDVQAAVVENEKPVANRGNPKNGVTKAPKSEGDDANREVRLMASILWPDAVFSGDKTIIADEVLEEVAEKRAGAIEKRIGVDRPQEQAASEAEERQRESPLAEAKIDERLGLLEKDVSDNKEHLNGLYKGLQGLQERDEHRLRSESEAEARVEALERQIWALRARLDEAEAQAEASSQSGQESHDDDSLFNTKKPITVSCF